MHRHGSVFGETWRSGTLRGPATSKLGARPMGAAKIIADRQDLKTEMSIRKSGGFFICTIQKFCEEIGELNNRKNIICLSDEAHRTQVKLNKQLKIKDKKPETKKEITADHLIKKPWPFPLIKQLNNHLNLPGSLWPSQDPFLHFFQNTCWSRHSKTCWDALASMGFRRLIRRTNWGRKGRPVGSGWSLWAARAGQGTPPLLSSLTLSRQSLALPGPVLKKNKIGELWYFEHVGE